MFFDFVGGNMLDKSVNLVGGGKVFSEAKLFRRNNIILLYEII